LRHTEHFFCSFLGQLLRLFIWSIVAKTDIRHHQNGAQEHNTVLVFNFTAYVKKSEFPSSLMQMNQWQRIKSDRSLPVAVV